MYPHNKLMFSVVLVMAQISQDPDPDLNQDLVPDQILEHIVPNQDQSQDLDQGKGQGLDQEPDQDLHPNIHSLTKNLVLVLILGQGGLIKRKSLMLADNLKDLEKQLAMAVTEVLEVKKARSYLRLVKEKLPQKCSQPFQTILIQKMKIKCQNRNLRKCLKRIRRIMQI